MDSDADQLKRLETKLHRLIESQQTLRQENALLRQKQAAMLNERNVLLSKQQSAIQRIDALMARLRETFPETPIPDLQVNDTAITTTTPDTPTQLKEQSNV